MALCRLLQACVGLGVLRSHTQESVTRYALTPVAREYLASSSPHSLAGERGAVWGRVWGAKCGA